MLFYQLAALASDWVASLLSDSVRCVMDAVSFDVVRARDGVVLATLDSRDAADQYANLYGTVMGLGEMSVVAREAVEDEHA